jgi:AcrR family transcriptional regulator
MAEQQRALEVKAALLSATARALTDADESQLRLDSICTKAKTTTMTVYYHFGSKDGLVEAAYLSLHDSLQEEDAAALELLAESVTSSEELIDAFKAVLTDPSSSKERAKRRHLWFRIYAAALTRPDFKAELAKRSATYTRRHAASIAKLQERGVISSELDAHQLAVLLATVTIGRSLNDVSSEPETDESWSEITTALVHYFTTR